jgi:hypothetical protein
MMDEYGAFICTFGMYYDYTILDKKDVGNLNSLYMIGK